MLAVAVAVILCSSSLQSLASADDVFASSAHLRLLADGEQLLVNALTDYLTAERRRLEQLNQLAFQSFANPLSTSFVNFGAFLSVSAAGNGGTYLRLTP